MANGDGMAAIMVGRLRCRLAGSASGSPDDSESDHRSDIVPRSGDSLRVITNDRIWR